MQVFQEILTDWAGRSVFSCKVVLVAASERLGLFSEPLVSLTKRILISMPEAVSNLFDEGIYHLLRRSRMSRRSSMGLPAACLLALIFPGLASAQDRSYWRHNKGYFENTTGKNWKENIDDVKHNFVETARTEKIVEIVDKKRNITVHLHADKATVKFAKGAFKKYYEGEWEKVFTGLSTEEMEKEWKAYERNGWHPTHIKGYASEKLQRYD